MGEAASAVVRMVEALDRGDLDGSVECFTPDGTFTNPVASAPGRDEIRALFGAFKVGLPDLSHEVSNVVEAGDMAAFEFVVTGTHTGMLVGPMGEIPATGKGIEIHAGAFARIVGGEIAEFRAYWDLASFLQQLGLMPEPAAATA